MSTAVAVGRSVLPSVEAARRRTFAIISHPDAGKTTLTERFLLYAGAVAEAGAVKARSGRRSATSDWMAMEQQRGISITSTALQFTYRDHVVNLLDTPGHREIPILTFLNEYHRPGRNPLELLDEIEERIGVRPTPVTWPVGIPGDFRRVIDRRTGDLIRYTRTARGVTVAPEELLDATAGAAEEGASWAEAAESCALLDEVGAVSCPRIPATPSKFARRTDAPTADRLARSSGVRVLARTDGALLALFESPMWLQRLEHDHADWTLETIVLEGDGA